jgi:hypothetical protein
MKKNINKTNKKLTNKLSENKNEVNSSERRQMTTEVKVK